MSAVAAVRNHAELDEHSQLIPAIPRSLQLAIFDFEHRYAHKFHRTPRRFVRQSDPGVRCLHLESDSDHIAFRDCVDNGDMRIWKSAAQIAEEYFELFRTANFGVRRLRGRNSLHRLHAVRQSSTHDLHSTLPGTSGVSAFCSHRLSWANTLPPPKAASSLLLSDSSSRRCGVSETLELYPSA